MGIINEGIGDDVLPNEHYINSELHIENNEFRERLKSLVNESPWNTEPYMERKSGEVN